MSLKSDGIFFTPWMEDLTKQQLILLALLVSFVTSIATGVVTVSLVDQAPAGVSQTIHQIFEKTIERVVPSESIATVTKEIKIPVPPDEALATAVASVSKNFVLIRKEGTDSTASRGLLLDAQGIFVADMGVLKEESGLIAVTKNSNFPLSIVARNDIKQIVYLKADPSLVTRAELVPVLFKKGEVLLGQNVFILNVEDKLAVFRGIVTALEEKEATPIIHTDISDETSHGLGLFTLSGELVGLGTKKSDILNGQGFISIESIRSDLSNIKEELKSEK